jgi:hypothetical protein
MNVKWLFFLCTFCLPFTVNAKDKNFGDTTILEVISIYDSDSFGANIKDYPPFVYQACNGKKIVSRYGQV